MPEMIVKCAARRVKFNRASRTVSGFISHISPDEMGDVVVPEGVDLSYFNQHKTLDFEHDREKSIGRCRKILIEPGQGVWATSYISKTPVGEDALTMVEEGILGHFSIRATDVQSRRATDADRKTYGTEAANVWTAWKLMNYALTAMPMNTACRVEEEKTIWGKASDIIASGRLHLESAIAAGMPDAYAKKFHKAAPEKLREARRSMLVVLSGMTMEVD